MQLPLRTKKRVGKVVYAVKAVANSVPFAMTCLPQALATKFLLRSTDDIALKIGVSLDNKLFEAHAWVEKEGEIIIGDFPESNYTPIWTW